ELSSAVEFQISGEGTERALPMAIEYGVTDRFSLLAEPVAYTAIRPKQGADATGSGDVELTSILLIHREVGALPALAVWAEVKLPTAQNDLIGPGKPDYAGYLIASGRRGSLDLHANVGFAILGPPSDVSLHNIFTGAFAAEWRAWRPAELFGEVLGNT